MVRKRTAQLETTVTFQVAVRLGHRLLRLFATYGPFGTFETFGTSGTFRTFETLRTFWVFETYGTFETFGMLRTFGTFAFAKSNTCKLSEKWRGQMGRRIIIRRKNKVDLELEQV